MTDAPRRPAFAYAAIAAVLLLAINLRPGATSIGPVLAELRESLGMSGVAAGVLTALPGICFAVFGATAVSLAVRLSLNGAITLGALAIAIGLGARSFVGDQWSFLGLSVLAFAGMALGNVLVPSFIKRHFPLRTPTLSALYATGLALGATAASLAAAPIAQVAPGGWRASVGIWGVGAAATLLLWVPLTVRERRHARASGHRVAPGASLWGVARSPKAVALGLFFGTQSMQAYVQFGWIAQMLRDGGLGQTSAGLMASIIAACGIPSGLVMAGIVESMRDPRRLGVVFGLSLAVGYLGVLFAPSLALLWALCLGLSSAAFPTAIALITARSRAPHVTAQVSGFTQSLGYLLAAAGPFAVGALHDLTGGWTVPLLALTASSVVLGAAGWVAAGHGYIDDELPDARG
ncbi:MFS transporter [Nigerium sp.]|uniref:MFS transporter n=1 Tax=Nigerium sp. TaxID=2042655 RepID=UPI00322176EF